MHAIGEQVRKIMTSRNVSLAEISKAVGVDAGALSRLERSNSMPRLSIETADRIAKYFGYEIRLVRTRK